MAFVIPSTKATVRHSNRSNRYSFFLRQQALLQNPQASHQEYTPLSPVHYAGDNPAYAQLGFQLLQRGKVGCVVLAGGQGSRLKFDGPKGLYPVSSVKKKPLYQLVAEKVAAASKWVGDHCH